MAATMNKALFLDRDGIINVDKGYVYRFEDIVWIPETLELIKLANEKGYKVIVLTNQSGVVRQKYTENDVLILHEKMSKTLAQKGLRIDDWFYCTDLESDLRKPRPGMLLGAQKKHQINLSESYMVGDKPSDVFQVENEKDLPFTTIVKGHYDLGELVNRSRVAIVDTHQEMLDLLKNRL